MIRVTKSSIDAPAAGFELRSIFQAKVTNGHILTIELSDKLFVMARRKSLHAVRARAYIRVGDCIMQPRPAYTTRPNTITCTLTGLTKCLVGIANRLRLQMDQREHVPRRYSARTPISLSVRARSARYTRACNNCAQISGPDIDLRKRDRVITDIFQILLDRILASEMYS